MHPMGNVEPQKNTVHATGLTFKIILSSVDSICAKVALNSQVIGTKLLSRVKLRSYKAGNRVSDKEKAGTSWSYTLHRRGNVSIRYFL